MAMSERVARLRPQRLDAVPTLSTGWAEIMTRFCREHTTLASIPVRHALAFAYLLGHKAIDIGKGAERHLPHQPLAAILRLTEGGASR